MKRIEAYDILAKMMGNATEKQQEALGIAMDDIEFVDLMNDNLVYAVRCKDCKHGIWDEDEEMYLCVESADYDPEIADYFGFISYEDADFYCKRGERREDNEK